MAFARLLGDDEPEKKRDGFVIGRVEWNGNFRASERSRCRVALRHTRMWNRDPMTQTRRAQLFACDQAIENLGTRKAVTSRKQEGDSFEQSQLVPHVEIQMDVLDTQQFANWVHPQSLRISTLPDLIIRRYLDEGSSSPSSSLSLAR